MRRITFYLVLLLALSLPCFGISEAYEKEIKALSTIVAEGVDKSGKKTIAVVDFTDLQGNVTELGRFLAEEFSVALSEMGKGYEVVDRTHLKTLLKEHQLVQTGLIDQKTARKLGEIAGVQALVTGTLTPFGDSIRLAVKVLDTSTAKVIGGTRGDIAKTKAIEELLAKGIDSGLLSSQHRANQPVNASSQSTTNRQSSEARYQDFREFRVEVANLQVLSDGKVSMSITYVNKTDKDYIISLPDWCNNTTSLTDDVGNQYQCDRHIGIDTIWGTPGGLTLSSTGTANATFFFNPPPQRAKNGNKYSFNSTQLLRTPVVAGKPITKAQYSISLLNITP